MTMLEAILAWIGTCTAACLSALGILWIGWKLFGRFESDSFEDVRSLQKRIDALELKLKALEMKFERNKD